MDFKEKELTGLVDDGNRLKKQKDRLCMKPVLSIIDFFV